MKRLLIPLLMLLVSGGCVQSLRPFYTDNQLTLDHAFEGVWTDGDGIITVSPDEANHQYKVTYLDKDQKTNRFVVHLAKVQTTIIADVFPEEPKLDAGDAYLVHLMPVHSFLIVSPKSDEISLRMMNVDWCNSYLHDHPDAVSCQELDKKQILLTGPTEQIQAFVLKHMETPNAYNDEKILTRLMPTTRPTTQP